MIDAVSLMLYGDNSDLKDDCGCKQWVGQKPIICPAHVAKLARYNEVLDGEEQRL